MLLPDSWPREDCSKHEDFVICVWECLPYLFSTQLALFWNFSCIPDYDTVFFHFTWEKVLPVPVEGAFCILLWNWYDDDHPCEYNSKLICTFQYQNYSFQINCVFPAVGYTTAENRSFLRPEKIFLAFSYLADIMWHF